eukprot:scpid76560/ scgid13840/ 
MFGRLRTVWPSYESSQKTLRAQKKNTLWQWIGVRTSRKTLSHLEFDIHEMLTVADCPCFNSAEDMSTEEKDDLLEKFKSAFRNAGQKLRKCMTTVGQPGINFLKHSGYLIPSASLR